MVSIRLILATCAIVLACEGSGHGHGWGRRPNDTEKEQRREKFLAAFLESKGLNVGEFLSVQDKLIRHRQKLANQNKNVNPEEQIAAEVTQQIQEQDKDQAEDFDDIRSINDPIKEFLYEGDIMLTDEQAEVITSQNSEEGPNREKRQAQTGPAFPRNQWTVGTPIPYQFNSAISTATRALIRQAIQFWQDNTCLSFVESTSGTNKLNFIRGSGCYSYVGKVYTLAQQDVSIGQGCELFGIITHEVGHALGFFHTMSRYDRDSYVSIQTQNIPASWIGQYDKETTSTNNNYNVEYDFGSVMHYPEGNGAVGSPIEILSRQPLYQRTMGNRIQPSFDDILLMNRYYGCINRCTSGATCQNGGFRNSRNCNICICPSGFGGATCNQRAAPENGASNCGATVTATSSYQTLTGQVGSNTGTILDRAQGCHWHIQAPAGHYVEIKVTSIRGSCSQGCAYGGTEIKHQGFTRTGTRLCCPSDVNSVGTVRSAQSLAVVSLYSYVNTQQFTLQYRAVSSGGAPAPGPSPVPSPGPCPPTPAPSPAACTDNANCAGWVAYGFCTNTFYTTAQKQQYCPRSCGFCTNAPAPGPAPSTSCTDNSGCPGWVANGFCTNTFYSTTQKRQTCPNACKLC